MVAQSSRLVKRRKNVVHPKMGANFRIPLVAPKPWSVPNPVSARISALSDP